MGLEQLMVRSRHNFHWRPKATPRPMGIADFFESAILKHEYPSSGPQDLYHYTKSSAARGILSEQKFHSTAHDCTNDKAELKTAHATVIEIAKAFRQENKKGLTARVLDEFLSTYPESMISEMRTAYLSCFSISRDNERMWNEEYGDHGRGICLGLRVVDEPGPVTPDAVSQVFEVIYSESSLRPWLAEIFGKFCETLSGCPPFPGNCEEGVAAFTRIAAFASIKAKHEDWKYEQEFRHVTLSRYKDSLKSKEQVSTSGRRWLPVSLRADNKLIALDEIIIGANQDTEKATVEFKELLADVGYVVGSIEYPRFTVSAFKRLASE